MEGSRKTKTVCLDLGSRNSENRSEPGPAACVKKNLGKDDETIVAMNVRSWD